jgi:UDP-N-acetylmuramoylalanine--D-glutamate ligase
MKVTVVGSGISGKSLALLSKKLGYEVFVTEREEIDPETRDLYRKKGILWEEKGHTNKMLDCDLVVLSSGISPQSLPVEMAKNAGVLIQGELDFVFPYLTGKIIGVTGTNGKSTTSALIAHLLSKLGYKTALAGNFGFPLADFAKQDLDFIAAEISSFQLHWANRFSCHIAVVTNICPDHLDWHGSFKAYVESKKRIIDLLSSDGYCVYQNKDRELLRTNGCRGAVLRWASDCSTGKCEEQDEIILHDSEAYLRTESRDIKLFSYSILPLYGRHNVENTAMAMAAVYYLGCDAERTSHLLSDFKNLPHRCEKVGEKKGITFIDDSKGTNVASSITAITSIPGTKVIILGGKGKGEQYDELAKAVKAHARGAVLLGAEKGAISEALESAGFRNYILVSSMEEAVYCAFNMACPGDIVLLSPACTSWDMYKNYHERGEDFKRIVKTIVEADSVKNG